MSKHAGLKLAIAALVVSGGLYLALEWLRPYHHVEVKMEGLASTEQVFAAAPGSAGDTSSTAAEAAPAQPASPVTAEPPAAAVQMPRSEPAAMEKAAPAEAPPAEAMKPVAKAKPAETTRKAGGTNPEPEDSGKAWWLSAASPSGFSVIYAGSAAFRRALVVMGNAPFASADSANAAIKVLDASGKPVSGHWELNSVNPSMLVFPLSTLGVYRMQIGAALSDRQNRTLGTALQGSIQVH